MKDQNEVYEAVVARGYREGWSAEQFVARQVCKLVEEVGEAAELIFTFPGYFQADVRNAGHRARILFDWKDTWDEMIVSNPQWLAKELADIQVVLFCAAAALGELTGEPFDLVQAARDKALMDVGRGVR